MTVPEIDAAESRRPRSALQAEQLSRLNAMLDAILPANAFYRRKLGDRLRLESLDQLQQLPVTTKQELLDNQERYPPYGDDLTYPIDRYRRYHQTSGTTGRPLRWLDTEESWQAMLDCWRQVYDAAQIRTDDRLFFAFSFGPFFGFWTAFEAACQWGSLCLPGGGMTSKARLQAILDNRATVVFCTPTYAMHLAETARGEGIDLASASVRALIVAGEPGGSIPATRSRIEKAWGARVFDQSGLTEVGPMTFECVEAPGALHVMEHDYVVEVVDPQNGKYVADGEVGEVIVTNLRRWASPVIRYKTGDLVRVTTETCSCGRTYLRFLGGIVGRSDDLLLIRGNNVYPSAIEAIIRTFPEIEEYRIEVDETSALTELRITIEPSAGNTDRSLCERVAVAIRDRLHFRPDVVAVAAGTLPRFELKARRVVRRRSG